MMKSDEIKKDLELMSGLPGYSEYEQRAQIEADGWHSFKEWMQFRAGSHPELSG